MKLIPRLWVNNEYKFGHFVDENYRRASSRIWTDFIKYKYNIDDEFWKRKKFISTFSGQTWYKHLNIEIYNKKVKRNKIGNNAFFICSI